MNKFLDAIKKGTIFFFKHHLYIMVILFVIDMVTKFTMEAILLNEPTHRITVIDGFFRFTLVYNPGGFSGLLGDLNVNGFDIGTFILMLCSILGAIIAILYFVKHFFTMGKCMRIGLFLVIPGCIGNLIDRFLKVIGVKPGVIDFLDFHLPLIGDFPVFNFADSCLTVAMVFIVIGLFMDEKAKEDKEKEGNEENTKSDIQNGEDKLTENNEVKEENNENGTKKEDTSEKKEEE